MNSTVAPYPAEREAHVALRDGTLAHVRPIRLSDEPALLEFLQTLPDDDRRMRFFSLSNDLSRTAHAEADVDYVSSLGLLAMVGPEERIVGHALYAPSGDGRAEVAFAIARDYQGHGLATLLLGQLAEVAAAHSIHTFEQREELAAANALQKILYPHSVAAPCDVGALEDILLRVGALAEDHPQVIEIDCNPVIVSASGALVVDARIRVAAAPAQRPIGARR